MLETSGSSLRYLPEDMLSAPPPPSPPTPWPTGGPNLRLPYPCFSYNGVSPLAVWLSGSSQYLGLSPHPTRFTLCGSGSQRRQPEPP